MQPSLPMHPRQEPPKKKLRRRYPIQPLRFFFVTAHRRTRPDHAACASSLWNGPEPACGPGNTHPASTGAAGAANAPICPQALQIQQSTAGVCVTQSGKAPCKAPVKNQPWRLPAQWHSLNSSALTHAKAQVRVHVARRGLIGARWCSAKTALKHFRGPEILVLACSVGAGGACWARQALARHGLSCVASGCVGSGLRLHVRLLGRGSRAISRCGLCRKRGHSVLPPQP